MRNCNFTGRGRGLIYLLPLWEKWAWENEVVVEKKPSLQSRVPVARILPTGKRFDDYTVLGWYCEAEANKFFGYHPKLKIKNMKM